MVASKEASGKLPALLLATPADARVIAGSARDEIAWTVTDDVDRARALASTGAFVAVFGVGPVGSSLAQAIELDPMASGAAIASSIEAGIERATRANPNDDVGALSYDEYIELARYATTRRYLISLLRRHRGSVTDAARGAKMKRESLHRLLRRHHLIADDFRER